MNIIPDQPRPAALASGGGSVSAPFFAPLPDPSPRLNRIIEYPPFPSSVHAPLSRPPHPAAQVAPALFFRRLGRAGSAPGAPQRPALAVTYRLLAKLVAGKLFA